MKLFKMKNYIVVIIMSEYKHNFPSFYTFRNLVSNF